METISFLKLTINLIKFDAKFKECEKEHLIKLDLKVDHFW